MVAEHLHCVRMAGIPFSGGEAVADVQNHLANLDLVRITAETNWLQAKG